MKARRARRKTYRKRLIQPPKPPILHPCRWCGRPETADPDRLCSPQCKMDFQHERERTRGGNYPIGED